MNQIELNYACLDCTTSFPTKPNKEITTRTVESFDFCDFSDSEMKTFSDMASYDQSNL